MAEKAAVVSQTTWHIIQRVQYLAPKGDEVAMPVIWVDLKDRRCEILSNRAIRLFPESGMVRDFSKEQKPKVLGVAGVSEAEFLSQLKIVE